MCDDGSHYCFFTEYPDEGSWFVGKTSPTMKRYTVEPELAELVRKLAYAINEDKATSGFELMTWLSIIKTFAKLKPHQLRACGIEVDDEH